MKNKKFNAQRIKKGILAGITALSLGVTSVGGMIVNPREVEAKNKRNKKPKLTLKGQLKNNKVTIEEGDKIKVNATAKDKEDGNITKKIKIKVKSPEDGEYEKKGKTITFINDGTYKVTVSVQDSKKAKTTKTRTIIVKEKEESNANNITATNKPIITPTPMPSSTPEMTQTPKMTQIPSVTQSPVSSEVPTTTSEPMPENYSNYDITSYKVKNKNFNITDDQNFITEKLNDSGLNVMSGPLDSENIIVENNYYKMVFLKKDMDYLIDNYLYLDLLGDIKAYDSEGNDISNSIVIIASTRKLDKEISIYAEDSAGKGYLKKFNVYFGGISIESIITGNDGVYDYINYDPDCVCFLWEKEKLKSTN